VITLRLSKVVDVIELLLVPNANVKYLSNLNLTTMLLQLQLLGEGAFLRTVLTTNIPCAKERSLAQ
jgi:hypothetical protein